MYPVNKPARLNVDDIGVTVTVPGGPVAVLNSESDSLPAVQNGELFVLLGTDGHANRGLWWVCDNVPTTSQFTAVKIGTLPVTDHDMPGTQLGCGGHLYFHEGDRAVPDAASKKNTDVMQVDLTLVNVPGMPPPE